MLKSLKLDYVYFEDSRESWPFCIGLISAHTNPQKASHTSAGQHQVLNLETVKGILVVCTVTLVQFKV